MIRLVVPTLNAASQWSGFVNALLKCARPEDVLVVDSSSSDSTADLARAEGFRVHVIERSQFSHGGTRQMAVELLPEAEILVFLTQDAVLADRESVCNLVACFRDPDVGVAYGRQLPKPGADAIEAHARLFNYSDSSYVHNLSSRDRMGLKTVFVSNSFAAYRRSALMAIGGFRAEVIMGEDTLAAAHMLLMGWKVAYAAQACAYHSHSYSLSQEFKRYFDIGVLHRREQVLLARFGKAGGEGKRFVKSEIGYLASHDPVKIPSALVRTALKLAAYRLGGIEQRLSPNVKRHLSMHHAFWTEGV
jgi:rhamnosyltransferase